MVARFHLVRASVLRRTALLAAAVALAACVAPQPDQRQALALDAPAPGAPVTGRKVAILLPLTGSMAPVGQAMLKGAQLALAAPGAPPLEPQDTGGTPDGAARAAQAALAAGAGLILGPLTAGETGAVATIAQPAGVPVLAFTSDSAQARPGVYAMGITPAQQVRRLVLAMQAENKSRITAVVTQNAFGDALTNGLVAAATAAAMPAPRIVRTSGSFASITDAMKEAAGYATRRGAMESEQRAARARNDDDGKRQAEEIGRRPIPPPPMDALFLGLNGDQLGQAVPMLAFYDVGPTQLRVLGPATWARDAARHPALAGAWFAAPDPAARTGFEQQFTAKFGTPPNDFSGLAYDAAGIARTAATPAGFAPASLVRPEGYVGAYGLLALQPDGQVRRGLAIFEVDRGGTHIVQPAPSSFAAPGS